MPCAARKSYTVRSAGIGLVICSVLCACSACSACVPVSMFIFVLFLAFRWKEKAWLNWARKTKSEPQVGPFEVFCCKGAFDFFDGPNEPILRQRLGVGARDAWRMLLFLCFADALQSTQLRPFSTSSNEIKTLFHPRPSTGQHVDNKKSICWHFFPFDMLQQDDIVCHSPLATSLQLAMLVFRPGRTTCACFSN